MELLFSGEFIDPTNVDSLLTSAVVYTSKSKRFKRNILCPFCGRKFHFFSEIKRHILIHTGETPFHCELCGRGFNKKSNLNAHFRMHSNEKPFECDKCGKCYKSKSSLMKHEVTHVIDNM